MKANLFSFIILFCLLFFVSCDSENDAYYIDNKTLVSSIPSNDLGDISFMHISDTHGSSISVKAMVEALNKSSCDFGIITGDILPDLYMQDVINSSQKPIFLVIGNHDAYNDYYYEGKGQYGFRKTVIDNNITVKNLNFGDNKANYYYYDYSKGGYILRIICLDQFELDAVARLGLDDVIMSQKQIDWFINVLSNSYQVDGIIILIHEGFGNSKKGARNINYTNNFISCLAVNYGNSYDFNGDFDPFVIPDIVEAYQTGKNISNQIYSSGIDDSPIHVTTNFGEIKNQNFIGYFGGHLHWDVVEFMQSFPNQLLVLMAYSGNGLGGNYNDLIKSDDGKSSYNINLNILKFDDQLFEIYRLGAQQTVSGVERKNISFKIFNN